MGAETCKQRLLSVVQREQRAQGVWKEQSVAGAGSLGDQVLETAEATGALCKQDESLWRVLGSEGL